MSKQKHAYLYRPKPTVPIDKLRVCLKCQKEFYSAGPWNRICPKCTSINHQQHVSRFVPPPSNYDRKEAEGP